MADVVRKLVQRFGVAAGGDALDVERGKLSLHLADDGEVQRGGLIRRAMAQDRASLTRIVIAVVEEIYDAPADLSLQAPCGPHLGHEKAPREEAAGLLTERDNRFRAHTARPSSARRRGGRTAGRSTLRPIHAAQPMRLYQR